jgi:hypothetical protein
LEKEKVGLGEVGGGVVENLEDIAIMVWGI